jgi:glycosyltransferase involved in cell wall biosynthesis
MRAARFGGVLRAPRSRRRVVKRDHQREQQGVLWITNLAAPYRVPVWRELSKQVVLRVALLVDPRNFHLDAAHRGAEWVPTAQVPADYEIGPLKAFRVPRIKRSLHVLHVLREWGRFPARGSVLLGGWEEPVYWQALMLAKLKGCRAVGFYESTNQSQVHRRGMVAAARRYYFRSLDAVVVPGVEAAAAIEGMGVPRAKIWQGFNAVDVVAFHEARLRCGDTSSDGGHRFVYVGRLIELKNLISIITAFGRAALDGDTLTIIGSGDQLHELHRHVSGLGLQERVVFSGPASYEDLPDILVRYDTLILASLTEVWGLVVNEALAAGLHCVVGQRCGVAASVKDMAGVFVADVDVDALARSMRLSRDAWDGPIPTPEILDKTPAAFASTFAAALRRE